MLKIFSGAKSRYSNVYVKLCICYKFGTKLKDYEATTRLQRYMQNNSDYLEKRINTKCYILCINFKVLQKVYRIYAHTTYLKVDDSALRFHFSYHCVMIDDFNGRSGTE